jgi:hypothetical protein
VGQVLRRVDVVRTAHVAALDQGYQLRVRPQEGTRSGISGHHGQHGQPVVAGDEDRVARLAVIGRHRDGCPGGVRGDEPADRR